METNIQWKGIAYHSNELCHLTKTSAGVTVNATINGSHGERLFNIKYQLEIDLDWKVSSGKIISEVDKLGTVFKFQCHGENEWVINGASTTQFNGCVDVDMSLTPFTNSLPINRLKMPKMRTQEIQVIYFDLLESQLVVVKQRYTKLSAKKYKYENVPNDFEAVIDIDESGLVLHYPGLFVRV